MRRSFCFLVALCVVITSYCSGSLAEEGSVPAEVIVEDAAPVFEEPAVIINESADQNEAPVVVIEPSEPVSQAPSASSQSEEAPAEAPAESSDLPAEAPAETPDLPAEAPEVPAEIPAELPDETTEEAPEVNPEEASGETPADIEVPAESEEEGAPSGSVENPEQTADPNGGTVQENPSEAPAGGEAAPAEVLPEVDGDSVEERFPASFTLNGVTTTSAVFEIYAPGFSDVTIRCNDKDYTAIVPDSYLVHITVTDLASGTAYGASCSGTSLYSGLTRAVSIGSDIYFATIEETITSAPDPAASFAYCAQNGTYVEVDSNGFFTGTTLNFTLTMPEGVECIGSWIITAPAISDSDYQLLSEAEKAAYTPIAYGDYHYTVHSTLNTDPVSGQASADISGLALLPGVEYFYAAQVKVRGADDSILIVSPFTLYAGEIASSASKPSVAISGPTDHVVTGNFYTYAVSNIPAQATSVCLEFDGVQATSYCSGFDSNGQYTFGVRFLESGQSYVRAHYVVNGIDYYSSASVAVGIENFGPLKITAPADDKIYTEVPYSVEIKWNGLSGAADYQILIEDTFLGTTVRYEDVGTATSYTFAPVEDLHTYRVTVYAYDNDGNMTSSQITFRVNAQQPKIKSIKVTPSTTGYRSTTFTFKIRCENVTAIAVALGSSVPKNAVYADAVAVEEGLATWTVSHLSLGSHAFTFVAVNSSTDSPQYVYKTVTLNIIRGAITWDTTDSYNGVEQLTTLDNTRDVEYEDTSAHISLDALLMASYGASSISEDLFDSSAIERVILLRDRSGTDYAMVLIDSNDHGFHLTQSSEGYVLASFLDEEDCEVVLASGSVGKQLSTVMNTDLSGHIYYDMLDVTSLYPDPADRKALFDDALKTFAAGISRVNAPMSVLFGTAQDGSQASFSSAWELLDQDESAYRNFMHPVRTYSEEIQ